MKTANRASTIICEQPLADGWDTLTAKITADQHFVSLRNGKPAAKGKPRGVGKSPTKDYRSAATR